MVDAWSDELLGLYPRVGGEPTVDRRFAVRLDHQEYAEAVLLGSGERSAEEDETLVGKLVHERRVLVLPRSPVLR
jgi:hypothetical protein